jgi:hypothetical protein
MVLVPQLLFSRLLEVREVLMFSFDFELLEQPLDPAEYTTPSPWLPAFTLPGASATVVGRDAMGGVYLTCELASAHSRRCLHLDTRGHVVLLGETLQDAVTLLVALPYWRELLSEGSSVGLDAMRAHAGQLEREVCEDLPALPEAREYLQGFLGFPVLADPVERLYELTAQAGSVTVMSPHGWRYESPTLRGARPT